MMRALMLLACISSVAAGSPSPVPLNVPVLVQFVDARLADVLRFYEYLSKKKASLDPNIDPAQKVSVYTRTMMSKAEALSFIRIALRNDGVDIHDIGDSEVYVSCVAQ
jgi:aspartokinase